MNTFLEVLIRVLSTGPDALTRTQLEGIATTFGLAIPPGASDQDVRTAISTHIATLPNPNAPSGIMLPAVQSVPTPPTPAALKIRPNRLPNARQGRRYNQQLNAAGGCRPYAWGVNETWVSVNPTTGRLSGKPGRWDESQDIEVTVTDSNGVTTTQPFSLRVEQREPIVYPEWVRPLAIIAGILAALIIILLAVPPLASWAWDHSYWGETHAQTSASNPNTASSDNETMKAIKALNAKLDANPGFAKETAQTTGTATPTQAANSLKGTGTMPTFASDVSHGAWKIQGTTRLPENPIVAGWLSRLKNPAPELWKTFPNIRNLDVPEFERKNCRSITNEAGAADIKCEVPDGMEYGTYSTPYCFAHPCDIPVGPWEYRYISGDYSFLGTECRGDMSKGCMLVLINVMDQAYTWRGQDVDNGFTLRGRYFNGDKLEWGAWGLISHGAANMLNMPTEARPGEVLNSGDPGNSGGNCGTPTGCKSVDVTLVVHAGDAIIAVAKTTVTK